MPKVSVVIPTYNRAELLGSAINSVLSQTFQDFEIVVVDDASRDNTAEVIRGFNDKRIKHVRHETNKGEAGARNTGVINSDGSYVAFLDDDDEWLPEKLERQIEIFERDSDRIGGVYTGFLKVDRATGQVVKEVIPTKRGNIFNELLQFNWIRIPSVLMVKKECFDRTGLFDASIPFGLDYDMWIRISKEFQFEYVDRPLVKYYSHADSRLSTNYKLVISGKEAMLKKYSDVFESNKKDHSYRYLQLGVLYCYSGNARKGREAFLRAIMAYPFEVRHYFNFCLSLLGASVFKKMKVIKENALRYGDV
ncbi:MAG TPA: glycosyltransferase [Thermodesulfobacteriota bacterium]|nr:glycosyltransferase [Thermodesulfobacteriota bacterium]